MSNRSTNGFGIKVRSKRSMEKITQVSKNMLFKKLRVLMNLEDIRSLGFLREAPKFLFRRMNLELRAFPNWWVSTLIS